MLSGFTVFASLMDRIREFLRLVIRINAGRVDGDCVKVHRTPVLQERRRVDIRSYSSGCGSIGHRKSTWLVEKSTEALRHSL